MAYRFSACACCSPISRRGFIAGAAALSASALAPKPARAAAQRIDVHHHPFPKPVLELQNKLIAGRNSLAPPGAIAQWTPQVMLDEMDKNETASVVLSIAAPGAWYGDVAGGRQIMRAWNDYVATLAGDHKGRVGQFAVLSPPDVEGSLKEIEYAYDVLKTDGIGIYTNYDDKYLGDAKFQPIFDELNRRKAVVFVHPTAGSCCAGLVPGLSPNAIEYPFDTTRTIASLLFNGTFSRHPDIKFIFSHGGGTLPMLAARMDELTRRAKMRENIPNGVPYELKRLYVDTANAGAVPALAAVRSFFPADHILYGTDYPYVPSATNVAALKENGLPDSVMAGIDRGNALALLPRFRS